MPNAARPRDTDGFKVKKHTREKLHDLRCD